MSCPCFYPIAPRVDSLPASTSALPLGDSWNGLCCAAPGPPSSPDEADLRPLCNLGYARGRCSRFSDADPRPDAARFTISRDDGANLVVYYVLERDHHPFAHGPLQYSRRHCAFTPPPDSEALARQAWAYVQSYLRRKSQ
jgi:hypothetical protein